MAISSFIAEQLTTHPEEADVVKKVFKALEAAGKPVVKIDDREEITAVNSLEEALEIGFNLDEFYMITSTGGYVFIVLGNDWDCLTDYTVDLEEALEPVNEYIEAHW